MKQLIRAAALTLALATLTASPASASSGTHVKITSWKVQTSDGSFHKVSPGGTYKVCASKPAIQLKARSKVTGAQNGKGYDAVWTSDGKKYAKFSETWRKSGNFRFTFGIGAEGFQPAKYGLKLVEGSKTLGTSAVTLKTKKGC